MSESRQRLARDGLKGRVEELLLKRAEQTDHANGPRGMTLGEIVIALSLPKTEMPALNSVLVKLCNSGKLLSTMGPASSNRGRKTVKRYVWGLVVIQRAPKAPGDTSVFNQSEINDRRFLSMKR